MGAGQGLVPGSGAEPCGGPGIDGQHQSASDSHHKNKNSNKTKEKTTTLRLLSVSSPARAQVSALGAAPDTPAQLEELV